MTIIYFAGADVHSEYLKENNVKNMLFSFLYKDAWVNKHIDTYSTKFYKLTKVKTNLFLDSGAHTFQEKGGKKGGVLKIEDYMEKYIDFLKKYHKVFKVYVELDVEDIIGLPAVDIWFQRMKDEGLNPLRVWHIQRGLDTWKQYTKEFDYLGIGKFTELPMPILIRLMKIAEENNCKIHGFGCTNPSMLKILPFYSVDSTTWLGTEQYGQIPVYYNGKLKFYDKKGFFEKYNKFNDLKYHHMRKYAIIQLQKYARHITEIWKDAYFNKL